VCSDTAALTVLLCEVKTNAIPLSFSAQEFCSEWLICGKKIASYGMPWDLATMCEADRFTHEPTARTRTRSKGGEQINECV